MFSFSTQSLALLVFLFRVVKKKVIQGNLVFYKIRLRAQCLSSYNGGLLNGKALLPQPAFETSISQTVFHMYDFSIFHFYEVYVSEMNNTGLACTRILQPPFFTNCEK